jgi:hypothetical protein
MVAILCNKIFNHSFKVYSPHVIFSQFYSVIRGSGWRTSFFGLLRTSYSSGLSMHYLQYLGNFTASDPFSKLLN